MNDWKNIFRYNAEMGTLHWIDTPKYYKERNLPAPDVAGSKSQYRGQRRGVVVSVDGRPFGAHRIIWEMFNGPIPASMEIDHINGDPWDNRISNLRLATHAQNMLNRGVHKNNKIGIKGVMREGKGFVSRICTDGVIKNLGTFKTAKEASEAYQDASKLFHGEFSRICSEHPEPEIHAEFCLDSSMTTKQIGASIRKARGQRSIREVAGAAGLSRHQVTSIEQANTNYTIQSLLALAKVVGVTVALN